MATLKVDIIADASKATRAVDKVTGKFSTMKSKIGASVKDLGAGFAAGLGAGALIKGLSSSVTAASDLNETISKTQQVFGSAGSDILSWSKNSSNALGLSRNAALDAASTFAIFGRSAGLTGKPLGDFSKRLVSTGADLASFNNTSPAEAMTAIAAGLRGESEPLRKYGILMNEASLRQSALRLGLVKTTKQALTPQQRVLAAQRLILDNVGKAAGDFQRTSGGLANQQRILSAKVDNAKAAIGQRLLPVVLTTITTFGTLSSAVGKTVGFIQRNIDVIGPLAALFGLVAVMAGAQAAAVGIAGAVTAVYTSITKAARAAQIAWNIAVGLFPGALVVIAIMAVVAAVVILWKRSQTFRAVVLGVWSVVKSNIAAAGRAIRSTLSALVATFRVTSAAISTVMRAVRTAVSAMSSGVRATFNVVRTAWHAVASTFSAVWSTIRGHFSAGVSAIVSTFRRVPGAMVGALAGLAGRVAAPFIAAFSRVRALVASVLAYVTGRINAAKSAVSGAVNFVRGIYNGFANRFNAIQVNIPSVKVAGKTVLPGFTFGLPDLPHLATGGYVDRPTLALIGEGRSPEIVAPEPMLRSIIRAELAGGRPLTVNVNVPATANPAETGRAVVNAIKAYERAAGANWRTA